MASLDARLKMLEKVKPVEKLPFRIIVGGVNEERAEVLARLGRPKQDINLWVVLVRDGKKRLMLEQLTNQ